MLIWSKYSKYRRLIRKSLVNVSNLDYLYQEQDLRNGKIKSIIVQLIWIIKIGIISYYFIGELIPFMDKDIGENRDAYIYNFFTGKL